MKMTVTDKPQPLTLGAGTSLLELENVGTETIYRGWESVTTASAGDNPGVTLAAGEQISYGGNGLPLANRTLWLVCDAGKTAQLNYTQR